MYDRTQMQQQYVYCFIKDLVKLMISILLTLKYRDVSHRRILWNRSWLADNCYEQFFLKSVNNKDIKTRYLKILGYPIKIVRVALVTRNRNSKKISMQEFLLKVASETQKRLGTEFRIPEFCQIFKMGFLQN